MHQYMYRKLKINFNYSHAAIKVYNYVEPPIKEPLNKGPSE